MLNIFWSMAVALIIGWSASGAAAPVGLPMQQDDCDAPSLMEDLEAALALEGKVFADEDWNINISYDETKYLITINWFPTKESGIRSAVITLDYLMYDCGYSRRDIRNYYSDENFENILATYDDYERVAECDDGDVTLYEYELEYEGKDYVSKFWIVRASDTRVYDLHLVFEKRDADILDDYAEELFEDLPSCD